MDNIYDIRMKEKLLYILPDKGKKAMLAKGLMKRMAIVVNLYYLDTVWQYTSYLNQIPSDIAIYIYSSDPLVLEQVEKYCDRPIQGCLKNNRGRDISALLVEFKKYAMEYEYICFLHDKKAKHEYVKEDTNIWVDNMWKNLLATEDYVCNVMDLFQENEMLGLIVPPEPMGEYAHAWYGDAWNHNYEISKELAEKLFLQCDIRRDRQPITLSTAFWARTHALEKLFEYAWKYEDFQEEPMPIDGTISHGIERMLGYIVQDAGYDTATIMTKEYASWSLLFAQDGMRMMMNLLNINRWVQDVHDVKLLLYTEERTKNFFAKNRKVYLYGAGTLGKKYLSWCKDWQLFVDGFVVSNATVPNMEMEGIKVFTINELELKDNVGIIITVAPNLYGEIVHILDKMGFSNYIYGFGLE